MIINALPTLHIYTRTQRNIVRRVWPILNKFNFIYKLLLKNRIDYNNFISTVYMIIFEDIIYLNKKINYNSLILLLYFF